MGPASPARGRRLAAAVLVVGVAVVLWACSGGDDHVDPTAAGDGDAAGDTLPVIDPRQGGLTTAFDDSPEAFARAARNLNPAQFRVFADGKAIFEQVPPGLGPGFDADRCASCHVDDGRSRGPSGDGPLPEGMVARFDPGGVHGIRAEVRVRYEDVTGTYADGTSWSLRRPTYEVVDAPEGTDPDTVVAVRSAPPLIGLGLLEQIPRAELQDRADPDDVNGDGIAGRIGEATLPWRDRPVFGRFGWQGDAADVEHQIALALLHDLDVTSTWYPSEACAEPGVGPDRCPSPGGPATAGWTVDRWTGEPLPAEPPPATELGDRDLFTLTLYTRTLAVPAVRDVDDPRVRRGRAVFEDVGCASCHAGGYTTDDSEVAGLSGQAIDPGTDLLLYDMGEGLADRTVGGSVVTSRWRTAPLWGLGLASVVLGEPATYLHDGRARTVAEAILWHGGDAEDSQARFRRLPTEDREALLAYLAAR